MPKNGVYALECISSRNRKNLNTDPIKAQIILEQNAKISFDLPTSM